uniref:Uncharacterized protein n=1 Tax=Amphimedon queenslandica TaxID=400682 RepID=A0A1X7V2E9_AMPQE
MYVSMDGDMKGFNGSMDDCGYDGWRGLYRIKKNNNGTHTGND